MKLLSLFAILLLGIIRNGIAADSQSASPLATEARAAYGIESGLLKEQLKSCPQREIIVAALETVPSDQQETLFKLAKECAEDPCPPPSPHPFESIPALQIPYRILYGRLPPEPKELTQIDGPRLVTGIRILAQLPPLQRQPFASVITRLLPITRQRYPGGFPLSNNVIAAMQVLSQVAPASWEDFVPSIEQLDAEKDDLLYRHDALEKSVKELFQVSADQWTSFAQLVKRLAPQRIGPRCGSETRSLLIRLGQCHQLNAFWSFVEKTDPAADEALRSTGFDRLNPEDWQVTFDRTRERQRRAKEEERNDRLLGRRWNNLTYRYDYDLASSLPVANQTVHDAATEVGIHEAIERLTRRYAQANPAFSDEITAALAAFPALIGFLQEKAEVLTSLSRFTAEEHRVIEANLTFLDSLRGSQQSRAYRLLRLVILALEDPEKTKQALGKKPTLADYQDRWKAWFDNGIIDPQLAYRRDRGIQQCLWKKS